MDYNTILDAARPRLGHFCKACPICNGKACGIASPGPGSKGPENGALSNFEAWGKYKVNLDTICENIEPCTKANFLGREFALPVFVAPIGGMQHHYEGHFTDFSYNELVVKSANEYGAHAFIGESAIPNDFSNVSAELEAMIGGGIPTVKPWDRDNLFRKIDFINKVKSFAFSIDIDGAGLPFLKKLNIDAGCKTVDQLKEVKERLEVPFILKGIMTVKGALKAVEAGADAIVVSNHGGRALSGTPGTADVLPAIVEAVKGKTTIIVDGGIRSGLDVFRALAIGADAVLIGRPFVSMAHGAGGEGIKFYFDKIAAELRDTMMMCGAHSLDEITSDMVTVYR